MQQCPPARPPRAEGLLGLPSWPSARRRSSRTGSAVSGAGVRFMYRYVLAGDKKVFGGMLKSPSVQMLQDTFHWFIRADLSVLFKKYGVGQCVYILGLY